MQLVDLSIVIPTYTINQELEEVAVSCIVSMAGDLAIKEIIVCEDGGFFSPQLMELADIYIYNKSNNGFTVNVNRGWKIASGEFVAIVNSDTTMKSGELAELCQPDKVTCPFLTSHPPDMPYSLGVFWVTPRDVTLKRGYLNELLHTYASDSEYEERIKDILVKTDKVKIYHQSEATTSAAGINRPIEEARDQAIWGQIKKGTRRVLK